tara:strand:- start:4327 stop:4548 length:222 start_codon:yes stop_codon:yes gene_type:complete
MFNKPRGASTPAALKKVNLEGLSVRRLVAFFEEASKEIPEEDSKFYFNQMVDYFENHYNQKRGLDSASKILGL